MKVGLFPQTDLVPGEGPTLRFGELRAVARLAEEVGFDSLWIADHLIVRMPDEPELGCWEAFTILSGLAAVTSRIQLGSLVACASYRNPALLAKMVTTLDELSDGRFVLGLGAGWHEPEYEAFGYPFDHLTGRFEETLQILLPLLREGQVDFAGQFYGARNAVLRPRGPTPSGPPIWIGARGSRMLELTARHADAWNVAWWSLSLERIRRERARLLEVCELIGRDPATIAVTANVVARLDAPGRRGAANGEGIGGSPEELAAAIRAYAEVGVSHLVVSVTPGGPAVVERFGQVLDVLEE